MEKLLYLFLASIFVFSSCEKAELDSISKDEATLKSGMKVLNFRTHLSGESEVPPAETMATGQAIFMLNKEGTELSYKIIVSNIENVRMAHIHNAAEGTNGGVVAWLYPDGPPPATIPGKFNGILAEGVITKSSLVGPLEGMKMEDLKTEMYTGNTYVNVHTDQYPGGEIRGQIMGNMPMSKNK